MSEVSRIRISTWAALIVAAATVAGSLYLSIGLNLTACPLCYYQRTFAMSVLGVLVMALATERGTAAVLALPLAMAGLFVAGYHCYLVASGQLECPLGVFGVGNGPQQSLVAFVLLVLTLAWDASGVSGHKLLLGLGPIVLGLLFAAGSIKSTPPPPVPDKPYSTPLNTCRVPFNG